MKCDIVPVQTMFCDLLEQALEQQIHSNIKYLTPCCSNVPVFQRFLSKKGNAEFFLPPLAVQNASTIKI